MVVLIRLVLVAMVGLVLVALVALVWVEFCFCPLSSLLLLLTFLSMLLLSLALLLGIERVCHITAISVTHL